jgi:hypothetical protein
VQFCNGRHKSSKTTEIYTHVSNKDLCRITNPLDRLFEDKNANGITGERNECGGERSVIEISPRGRYIRSTSAINELSAIRKPAFEKGKRQIMKLLPTI